MKKSNLIKIFSILLIITMLMCISVNVFAADDLEAIDLTGTLDNNTSGGNTLNDNSNKNDTKSNTNINNTNKNNTNINNTNNSSVYNTNNLPKTGIGDSIPTAMLVVVFAISSIYAYRKIKEYKNI